MIVNEIMPLRSSICFKQNSKAYTFSSLQTFGIDPTITSGIYLKTAVFPIMAEHFSFPDVQGGPPHHTFDEEEASAYLIHILGRKERIPQRFDYKDGLLEILMCLRVRYGTDIIDKYNQLMHLHLANSDFDGHIWGTWRTEYARQMVRSYGCHNVSLLRDHHAENHP